MKLEGKRRLPATEEAFGHLWYRNTFSDIATMALYLEQGETIVGYNSIQPCLWYEEDEIKE